MSRMTQVPRDWLIEAVRRIEADFNRSSDTHLIHHEVAAFPGVHLYFKDESSHPTGSLKHRLARSLILYALCNEWIGPQTTLIESSSGSTAVSEAYFARLLGLRFIAVVPKSVAQAKIDAIRFQGGEVHSVDNPSAVYTEAQRLADETGGHYLDQFTYAERATDWRGNNNIAESLFSQMTAEPHPVPSWLVTGAGTGGTSATLGRYIRYRRLPTRLCVADPEGSVFHRHYHDRSVQMIDRMVVVTDAQSIAAVRLLSERLGRRVGGSTGTNLWACVRLMREMAQKGETGSIVTILCDGGERYADTYYSDDWLSARAIDWRTPYAELKAILT